MMDWNDLRFALAVYEEGSLSAAARRLGVGHATVHRRIAQMESQLGVKLFHKAQDGYHPTAAAEELASRAGRVQEEVFALERTLTGRDIGPSGLVRITTSDTVMINFLPEVLKELRQAHPAIELEVTVSNAYLSLTRQEADIALRPTTAPPETLYGRRLTDIAFAVYGAKSLFEAQDEAGDLGQYDWIGLDDSLSHTAGARWLRAQPWDKQTVLRCNSLCGLLGAARAGLGLAVLPCFMAENVPELQRCSPRLEGVRNELWLLAHRDVRDIPRVRAVLDFLAQAITARRHRLAPDT